MKLFACLLLIISCVGVLSKKGYVAAGTKVKPAPKISPKVVLITGCSTGIGKSSALEFGKYPDKYKVWASMRDVSKWDAGHQLPNVKPIQLDVSSDASVEQAISKIVEEDGTIDIVVNNAGYGVVGTVETVDISEAKNVFEVNFWGVARVLQRVLPYMRKARRGHIISISSTSGVRGMPASDFYVASKFALEGLTDSMRYSLAPYNILVTNVNPGPVETSFTDRFGDVSSGGRGSREVDDPSGFLRSLEDRNVESLRKSVEINLVRRNMRVKSADEGQSSDEVAKVIVNVAILGADAKKPSDVPFNIGTNHRTQALINDIRRYPTGWGGPYTNIMMGMPKMFPPQEEVDSMQSEL